MKAHVSIIETVFDRGADTLVNARMKITKDQYSIF
jgi:hypothetical protein